MKKDEHYLIKLIEYAKKNLKKGYTKDSLKWALVNQGYPRLEVDKAIVMAEKQLANEAPVLKTKPQITYERLPPIQAKKSWWKSIFE